MSGALSEGRAEPARHRGGIRGGVDAAGYVLESDQPKPVLQGQRFGGANLLPELEEGRDA